MYILCENLSIYPTSQITSPNYLEYDDPNLQISLPKRPSSLGPNDHYLLVPSHISPALNTFTGPRTLHISAQTLHILLQTPCISLSKYLYVSSPTWQNSPHLLAHTPYSLCQDTLHLLVQSSASLRQSTLYVFAETLLHLLA